MFGKNQQQAMPAPPFYFPLENGQYEVKPGLFKFPHDFGNGRADRQVFQFDRAFPGYRAEKLAARSERLHKYYCRHDFDGSTAKAINQFIIQKLVQEHPENFQLEQTPAENILHCRLSQEVLRFDRNYLIYNATAGHAVSPQYVDSFDALACQIQEDISVVHISETGDDQVLALHLCLPNHWAAEDKIGKSFIAVHQAVPEMEKINQSAKQLLLAMLHKGPFVRFAWGMATDTRLNHHPIPPSSISKEQWQGRTFKPGQAELFLRVERQTIHGFPEQQLTLFTIRTYHYDIKTIHTNFPEHIPLLISSIESMSTSSMAYKGLNSSAFDILNWLKEVTVK